MTVILALTALIIAVNTLFLGVVAVGLGVLVWRWVQAGAPDPRYAAHDAVPGPGDYADGGWEPDRPLVGHDPTDGIIPDQYPYYAGTRNDGIFMDGTIEQVAFGDGSYVGTEEPTIMPDGTVVLNGEIIMKPDTQL